MQKSENLIFVLKLPERISWEEHNQLNLLLFDLCNSNSHPDQKKSCCGMKGNSLHLMALCISLEGGKGCLSPSNRERRKKLIKKKTEEAVVNPCKLAGGVREQVEHLKLLHFLKLTGFQVDSIPLNFNFPRFQTCGVRPSSPICCSCLAALSDPFF